MDDLAQKLQDILNTEEGQQNLKRVADMLGANTGNGSNTADQTNNNIPNANATSEQAGSNFDLSALAGLLNNSQQSNNQQNNSQQSGSGPDLSALLNMLGNQNNSASNSDNNTTNTPNIINGLDINMLLKMQKLLSATNTEDSNTALIRALKPHLKPERQSRADEAIRMMQLMNLLPMLKESGLFGGGG